MCGSHSTRLSVIWGFGTVYVRGVGARHPGLDVTGFTAVQIVAGSVLLAVVGFGINGTKGVDWSSGELWWAVLFLAIGATALPYLLFYAALRRFPAVRVTATTFLVAVVAVVVEIARGHTPGAVTLAGMIVAIAGVAIVNMPADRLEAALGGSV